MTPAASPPPPGAPATAALTSTALCGFAANSLLCRLALGSRAIDPASFTSVRLLTGAVALAGIVVLTFPGLHAPDPLGVGLMAGAGIAWGIYSLRGRGTERPLAATAGNFARPLPFVVALEGIGVAAAGAHASARGLALAAASGALASGIGYAFWYAALRGLTATRAAVAQLAVPALAATGGVIILGETVTARLVAGGAAVLGGVALAVARRTR